MSSAYYLKNGEACRVRGRAWKRMRQEILPNLFAWGGGVCMSCGSSSGIVFLPTSHKDFGIGNNMGNSLEQIYNELDKCEILCRGCYMRIHKEDLLNGKREKGLS